MKNRQITNKEHQDAIIRKCQFCHVAMTTPDGKPYVIPMNFGYDGEFVYFHGSAKGKKADILKINPDVCIAFSTDHELRYVNEEVACSWSMRYKSVLVYGKAEFIEDAGSKIECLNRIMAQYADRDFEYNEPAVREVMVFRVKVEKMEGRVYGY
ncbi:MAG TPA: pyridoxamine 5'-phosphate oxidase family protein [Bacteroidales bacterium]|nr:pyridoxamine 5'-phosphate oxidase family protein [Bacteroidales bacterium]